MFVSISGLYLLESSSSLPPPPWWWQPKMFPAMANVPWGWGCNHPHPEPRTWRKGRIEGMLCSPTSVPLKVGCGAAAGSNGTSGAPSWSWIGTSGGGPGCCKELVYKPLPSLAMEETCWDLGRLGTGVGTSLKPGQGSGKKAGPFRRMRLSWKLPTSCVWIIPDRRCYRNWYDIYADSLTVSVKILKQTSLLSHQFHFSGCS